MGPQKWTGPSSVSDRTSKQTSEPGSLDCACTLDRDREPSAHIRRHSPMVLSSERTLAAGCLHCRSGQGLPVEATPAKVRTVRVATVAPPAFAAASMNARFRRCTAARVGSLVDRQKCCKCEAHARDKSALGLLRSVPVQHARHRGRRAEWPLPPYAANTPPRLQGAPSRPPRRSCRDSYPPDLEDAAVQGVLKQAEASLSGMAVA